jgi:hypothetical protein
LDVIEIEVGGVPAWVRTVVPAGMVMPMLWSAEVLLTVCCKTPPAVIWGEDVVPPILICTVVNVGVGVGVRVGGSAPPPPPVPVLVFCVVKVSWLP